MDAVTPTNIKQSNLNLIRNGKIEGLKFFAYEISLKTRIAFPFLFNMNNIFIEKIPAAAVLYIFIY